MVFVIHCNCHNECCCNTTWWLKHCLKKKSKSESLNDILGIEIIATQRMLLENQRTLILPVHLFLVQSGLSINFVSFYVLVWLFRVLCCVCLLSLSGLLEFNYHFRYLDREQKCKCGSRGGRRGVGVSPFYCKICYLHVLNWQKK